MIKNAPKFNNKFHQNVVETFHARSKTMKHNTQEIKLEQEMEGLAERLNIDVNSYAPLPYQIRLSLCGEMWSSLYL